MKKKILIAVLGVITVLGIGTSVYLLSHKVQKTVTVQATTEETSERFDLAQIDEYMNQQEEKTTEKSSTEEATTEKETDTTSERTTTRSTNTSTGRRQTTSGSTVSTSGSGTGNSSTGRTQTNTGSQPSTRQPSTQAPTTEQPTAPTCNHNWVEVTRTVHHDAVYETRVVHHDAEYEAREVCLGCGAYGIMTDPSCSCWTTYGAVPQRVLLRDAYDEEVREIVRDAYDEQVGIGVYECSRCHARK